MENENNVDNNENKAENDNKDNKNNIDSKNKMEYCKPNDITLQDLLEILQGPVPVENRIIIATTNDFDNIKTMCPALFRPGRLTPIHFGYPTKQIVHDIVKYYFDKEIDISIPDVIDIPTSQLIDICLDAKLTDNPYDHFIAELLLIIEKNDNHIKLIY